MGCDIHLVLERRVKGRWIGINQFKYFTDYDGRGCFAPVTSRNYVRFAALAGVRGDGPKPRGVPDDASDLTRLLVDEWEGDGHSHSWLPAVEFAEICLRTTREPRDFAQKYPMSEYLQIEDDESSGTKSEDFRVVFWFDN